MVIELSIKKSSEKSSLSLMLVSGSSHFENMLRWLTEFSVFGQTYIRSPISFRPIQLVTHRE